MTALAPSGAEPSARVLLIEDDPLDVELALTRLERSGIRVALTHVSGRRELLSVLERGEFDIVLCDFQLPGFSGSEALDIVRSLTPELPFIFVSGVLGEEHAVEMLRRGATDYVVKQRLERLPIAVHRAINEAEERRARQHAERSLREREAYVAKLVESLKDYSVVALDTQARIESWNAGSQTIFGYSAGEVLGRSAELLFPPSDSGVALARELRRAADDGSISFECWLMRKDGTPFHASVVISAIRSDDKDLLGYSHIVRDTTDSRLAADLLQSAKEQAEAANSAKDRFLAVLSHELRTPLNPIAAAAKLLEIELELTPRARESLDIIQRNIRMETRLIDDLLDISRIVNDKLTLELKRVNVYALVRQLMDAFSAEAHEYGLRFEVVGGLCAELWVQGDAARLQQLLGNLVKNALKFTPRGGSVIVRVTERGEEQVDIEVEDDGIGIAPVDRERIFHAFEQGGQIGDSARGGLGLGLAIAHTLAEKHGGSLAVHSGGVGLGARFVLTLKRVDGQTIPIPATPAGRVSPHLPLRILLVEDDSDTLRAEQALLEALGFEVATACSVAEADERLQTHGFDVLLTDIGLPDGSGIDVLRQFRGAGGDYAIALTGYGMQSDLSRLQAAGFSRHMVKPLAPDDLIALLQSVARDKAEGRPQAR